MAHGEDAVPPQEEPLREARTITSHPRGRTGVHPEDLYEAFDRIGRESADLRGDMAAELRRIDEVVAGAAAPVSAAQPTPEPPRRAWLAWVLGLGVVAAVVWGLAQCAATTGQSTATPSASAVSPSAAASVPVTGTSPSTAASPSPPASAQAATTVPMTWGKATLLVPPGLVTSGPGVTSPGSDVTYVADVDGRSFDVYQRVRLVRPAESVTLGTVTRTAAQLVPELMSLPLVVDALQVEVDGHPVTAVRDGSTWTARSVDGSAASSLVLRYRLTGAITQIRPTQAGRYAALLTPLVPDGATTPTHTPSVVHVSGTGLRNLTCPLSPPSGWLCGATGPAGASANVAAGAPLLLQLTFDR